MTALRAPRIACAWFLLLLLVLVSLAEAQQNANIARGRAAGRGHDAFGIDAISHFNGNLTIAIPIGQTYPVNAGFSYGLTLYYNSQAWAHEDFGGQIRAVPNQLWNAGLGWSISLGRFNPPQVSGDADNARDTYVSPDGGTHTFFAKLHHEDPASTGFEYTRDSSYLRWNGNEASPGIEFPGGERHEFDSFGYPKRLRDRFGNEVTITYHANRSSGASAADPATLNAWKITDAVHGRVHWVEFQGTGLTHQPKVLRQIDLQTFGGARAIYDFAYNQANPGGAEGSPVSMSGCWAANFPLPIWLLSEINGPHGLRYSMPTSSYGSTLNPCSKGLLERIDLPDRGSIAWTYGVYEFPSSSTGRLPWRRTSGVVERRMITPSGTSLTPWVYTTNLPANGTVPTGELVNTVVDPLGHQVKRYFAVCATNQVDGCTLQEKLDYGLPFSRLQPASGTRLLSAEVFESGSSAPLRRHYVQYENDPTPPPGANFEDHQRLNQRLFSARTNYVDDGSTFDAFVLSDFDGLGHYRTTTLSGGGFQPTSASSKTIFVDFNPGRGTYPGSFTMVPTSSPWLVNLFDRQRVTEGAKSFHARHCFDPATGFLQGRRVLEGTGASDVLGAHDVFYRATPSGDGRGNLAVEEYFGGDTQSLGTSSPCAASGSAVYRLDHSYSGGTRATSQFAGTTFRVLDLTVDPHTGLPSLSKDISEVPTRYVYDLLGRVTGIRPEFSPDNPPLEDGWTEFVYTAASGATEATARRVEVLRKDVNNGAVRAREMQRFDGFGRPWIEEVRMANGTESQRETLYDALGSPVSVSTLGDRAKKTLFEDYDPFGRPGRVVAPDGSETEFTYTGVRQITRSSDVGTGWTGSAIVSTTSFTNEFYDRQGRLYQLREPSDPSGANVNTTYGYDAMNRLVSAQTISSGVTQNRAFSYDGRGFLRFEDHPEKTRGNGGSIHDVEYLSYDAMGNVTRRIDGEHDLYFNYDAAGRLTRITQNSPFLPVKEFEYWTTNNIANGDYRLGKLRRAVRHNRFTLCDIAHDAQIEEIYTYKGRMGRVSRRDTALLFDGPTAGETFFQTFTWDALGRLASQTYPQCVTGAGGVACTAAFPRTVSNTYNTHGWLTAIPNFASSLSYHPNGMVATVIHANGVQDTISNDPDNLPRPSRIQASGNVWDSGPYQFDGSGNVVRMGEGYAFYDLVSRIKDQHLPIGPMGTGTQVFQTTNYDAFGNILSFGGTSARNVPTDSNTNRLCSASCSGGGTASYTQAGELTAWAGNTFEFERGGMLNRSVFGQEDWLHFYTADDERIWSYRVGSPSAPNNRWTLRGLDGLLLREYASDSSGWRVVSDYIYREGVLLAAVDAGQPATQARHFHLDHLGTVRAITNSTGARTSYHAYYPFGEEATSSTQDTERPRFTGHETDFNAQFGSAQQDDLTYMHARHFSAVTGRFLSTDPLGGLIRTPASLNRFGYAADNPLRYIDRDGRRFGGYLQYISAFPRFYESMVVTGYVGTADNLLLSAFSFYGALAAATGPVPGPLITREAERLQAADLRGDPFVCNRPPGPSGGMARRAGLFEAASVLAPTTAAATLAYMSRHGGRFDFKGPFQSDDFGNFHFGAMAFAVGLPLDAAQRGGGVLNMFGGVASLRDVLGPSPHGDNDQNDVSWVRAGYLYGALDCK